MKCYEFTIRDKADHSITKGCVDGETWQEAWKKLTPLMAGHIVINIEEVSSAPDSQEKEDGYDNYYYDEEEGMVFYEVDNERMCVVTFMLFSKENMELTIGETLANIIFDWFNDESAPQTLSFLLDTEVISLDRYFVGAVRKKYIDGLDEQETEEELTEETNKEEGTIANGTL